MPIHWYPGHMNKASHEMKSVLKDVDLIIELLDARLPFSSQNPTIKELSTTKPCIKVLSKSDLADPALTSDWQAHFEQEESVKTLATTLDIKYKAESVLHLCQKLSPKTLRSTRTMIAMITGIPNVGKSTLINALAGRKVAKTGNEPAITKGQQRIKINEEVTLLDTPGILWPKIHNENSGYRLAISGAIKDTAMNVEDVAFYLSGYLLKLYPECVNQLLDTKTLPNDDLALLEALGRKRGCLRRGGQVDLEKVSSVLVNEFRTGKLGRISLETPSMIPAEEAEVEQLKEEKKRRDELRKAKRKKK
ncbi:MAG: ribosome biogenesis GTPase YlqF [Gammaproteobacteria bacterium]|nr:ribosome biogenesis GTPase YlqF [Gammaproteobacteria bacterium]